MFKNTAYIRMIVGLMCFATLLWGCDKKTEAPPKPKVVTKKIVAKKAVSPPKAIAKAAPAKPEATKAVPQVQTKKVAKPPVQVAAKQEAKPPAESVVKPKGDLKKEVAADAVTTESKVVDTTTTASTEPDVQKLVIQERGYVYTPKGKLDPFLPLFLAEEKPAEVKEEKKEIKRRTPRTPLERVDLSQLKLVGVILSSRGNKALVEEATGKGYVVNKGTYIGTRNGKIVEILSDKIIVEEEVLDIYGKQSLKQRTLQIQKPPGE